MEIKPTKSNILQADRFNIYLEIVSNFLRLIFFLFFFIETKRDGLFIFNSINGFICISLYMRTFFYVRWTHENIQPQKLTYSLKCFQVSGISL